MSVSLRFMFSSLSRIALDISLSLSLNIWNHHPDVPDDALPSLDDLGRSFAFRAFENGGDLVQRGAPPGDVAIVAARALDPPLQMFDIQGSIGDNCVLSQDLKSEP